MASIPFETWFADITEFAPHPWQMELGRESSCIDRLLRIPTGFGKTAGTVLAWAYHRVLNAEARWPMRLVFCLPMRVLVEQTEGAIAEWFRRAKLDVPVTTLLGGRRESAWLERPELPAVIVGTQDMLLSRAMARGYGSARGLWPMEMGLLHHDALWVLDEVQLMDVGLATSAQLHAFRGDDDDGGKPALRKSFSWWMSATLQPSWLDTVDLGRRTAKAPISTSRIEAAGRSGGLWNVRKTLSRRADLAAPEEIASLANERHAPGSLTLVVMNTVERAKRVEGALTKSKSTGEVRLVHSRFRGAERSGWDFLRRAAKLPPGGRIVVATQVVEAGVDISATTLITDLAPWASLVQRFGRCARYLGEAGQITVVSAPIDEKKSLPYRLEELQAADDALRRLVSSGGDAGPASLETFEERLAEQPEALKALYPYQPFSVIRRRDLDDLFDTTPDLSGADLDVSRYIRSGDERDVSVFWREMPDVEGKEPKELRDIAPPMRAELCPVPVGELRDLLKKKTGYVRDYVRGVWARVDRIVPGMTVLLPAKTGGYDARRGWDPKSTAPVSPLEIAKEPVDPLSQAAAAADDDTLSQSAWKSIATHGRETGELASAIGAALGLQVALCRVLALAGRWHDAGKVHPVFQSAIGDEARATNAAGARRDLAKAPHPAWRKPPYPKRPGFRHELVSTLMLLELLRRASPGHPALTAPHEALFAAMDRPIEALAEGERIESHPLLNEIAALSADDFDLLAYLVCAHHGKVRTSWSSTPGDQAAEHGGIHGVCHGDAVPALLLVGESGAKHEIPESRLSLACAGMGLNARYGASWGERVARLVTRFGPFSLAYLEAIFRAADWRASQLTTPEHQ